jgi:hypothetical protein
MEWEIPISFKVEEIYHGTNNTDDPSHCAIGEIVEVVENVGPFRKGDRLLLTEDERRGFEEDEYNRECDALEDSWAEYQASRYEDY